MILTLVTHALALHTVDIHPCGGVCRNPHPGSEWLRLLHAAGVSVGADGTTFHPVHREFDLQLLAVPAFYARNRQPEYVLDLLCRLQDKGWLLLDLDILAQVWLSAATLPAVSLPSCRCDCSIFTAL